MVGSGRFVEIVSKLAQDRGAQGCRAVWHNNYLMVAKAWEAVRGADSVPGDMDAQAQEFMNILITRSDFCMDLGEEGMTEAGLRA